MNGATARIAEAITRELRFGRSEERAERIARLEVWQELHGEEHRWLEGQLTSMHVRLGAIETSSARSPQPTASPSPSIWRALPWANLAWPAAATLMLLTGHLTAAQWTAMVAEWAKKLGGG